MSSPDEPLERAASSGTTRTPPPRTRRGAPATRTTFDELEPLDAFADPGTLSTLDDPSSETEVRPRSGNGGSSSGARGRAARSQPYDVEASEPESYDPEATAAATAFDWDSFESGQAADAAVLAAAGAAFAEPVEPEIPFEPPATRPARPKPAKRPERRFRQTVQKIDLWSVTKISLCFYISVMAVVVVSLVALWVVADSAGIIDNVENFIGDLFSSEDFHFVSGQVLRGAILVGVVLVALLVAFTIIAASFYNIFAELFGGIEIVIREEEQPPKR